MNMNGCTVAVQAPALSVTFGHLRAAVGLMRARNTTTIAELMPVMHEALEQHTGSLHGFGEIPGSDQTMFDMIPKLLGALKPGISKSVAARRDDITFELLKKNRVDFELVRSYVDLGFITHSAGQVLIQGAIKLMPHLFGEDAMLGSHLDALADYFVTGEDSVSGHLELRVARALGSLGFREEAEAVFDHGRLFRLSDIPQLRDTLDDKISQVALRIKNWDVLENQYGLKTELISRAVEQGLMSDGLWRSIFSTIELQQHLDQRNRSVGSFAKGIGIAIGTGVLLLIGSMLSRDLGASQSWSRVLNCLSATCMLGAIFASSVMYAVSRSESESPGNANSG